MGVLIWSNAIITLEGRVGMDEGWVEPSNMQGLWLPVLRGLFIFYTSFVVVLIAQACLTLWDPVDCSPPGSPVHGILQARILEWVAMTSSRGSSQPRDWTQVSCIAGRFFTIWTTREALLYNIFINNIVIAMAESKKNSRQDIIQCCGISVNREDHC